MSLPVSRDQVVGDMLYTRLDRTSWANERLCANKVISKRDQVLQSRTVVVRKTFSHMLSISMFVGIAACSIIPIYYTSLFYLPFAAGGGVLVIYIFKAKVIDQPLKVREKNLAFFENLLATLDQNQSLAFHSVGDRTDGEELKSDRIYETIPLKNADFPEKVQRSVGWMAGAADRHHLEEYYLYKMMIAAELASMEVGDAPSGLLQQYAHQLIGEKNPEKLAGFWTQIESIVRAEMGSAQPLFSRKSWKTLKLAVSKIKDCDAYIIRKLVDAWNGGKFIAFEDYVTLHHFIELAEKAKKKDQQKLDQLKILDDAIRDRYPKYYILRQLDNLFTSLQGIEERFDLSASYDQFGRFVAVYKELEQKIIDEEFRTWITKTLDALPFWSTMKYGQLSGELQRVISESEWARMQRLFGELYPHHGVVQAKKEVVDMLVREKTKVWEVNWNREKYAELVDEFDTRFEKLDTQLREFVKPLRRSRARVDANLAKIWAFFRKRSKGTDVQTRTLPSDIMLDRHIKELHVNELLKRADKTMTRHIYFKVAGVDWLAIVVLLVVESIFITYTSVAVGVTASVLVLFVLSMRYQDYISKLDRDKLAIRMQRHFLRQVDPKLGHVPGHTEALQRLHKLSGGLGLDGTEATTGGLMAGKSVPGGFSRPYRGAMRWIRPNEPEWMKPKEERKLVNRAISWLNKTLYRLSGRYPKIGKTPDYNHELQQVHQRLEVQLGNLGPLPDQKALRKACESRDVLLCEIKALRVERRGSEVTLGRESEIEARLERIKSQLSTTRALIRRLKTVQSLAFVDDLVRKWVKPELVVDETARKKAVDGARAHLRAVEKSNWKRLNDECLGYQKQAREIEREQEKLIPVQDEVFGHLVWLRDNIRGLRQKRLKESRVTSFLGRVDGILAQAVKYRKHLTDSSNICETKQLQGIASQIDAATKAYDKALADDIAQETVERIKSEVASAQKKAYDEYQGKIERAVDELRKVYEKLRAGLIGQVQAPLADLLKGAAAKIDTKSRELRRLASPRQVLG